AFDRPGRPAARARDERRRRRGGVPLRARRDRHGRPLPGPGARCDRPPGRSGGAGGPRPGGALLGRAARGRAADRGLSLSAGRDGLCAARVRARRHARLGRGTGARHCGDRPRPVARARRPRRPPRRRHLEPAARRAALRPRRLGARLARAWLERGRRARSDRGANRGREAAERGLSGRALARLVGAHLPHLWRGPALGRTRPGVHGLGATGPRRRRQPRLAARQRLARRPDPPRRGAPRPRARPVGDPRHRSARARALRCCVMRALSAILACSAALLAPSLASADTGLSAGVSRASLAGATDTAAASAAASSKSSNPEAPIPVAPSSVPPAGRRLSPDQVLAIAEKLPRMRAVRRKYPGSYGGAYLKQPFRWQVSFFSRTGKKEIGQVLIDDLSGRVVEQWTGFQVAWTMARGYPGAFGRHVNALYI